MEVKSLSESSLLNVENSSRSEKKKMKKKEKRKHQDIEIGNAESKEAEASVGTDSKLGSEANADNSLTKDAHLETEESTRSRRKRKRKVSPLIDEKQSGPFIEPGLKEEANSLMEGTVSEGDSNVGTVENNVGLESGLKGSRLNEHQKHSERKAKKKKKKRKEGPEPVVELSDVKGNSLIDEKQSDSHLESGLKGVPLKEQAADSERKRKSRKKLATAGKCEKLDGKFVVEMSNGKENSVIGEKQSDFDLVSKLNVSLESGLKVEANSLMDERDSLVETLETISSESGLKGSQLNEQPADSKSKRKRKKKRVHKMGIAEKLKNLDAESVLELRESKENPSVNVKQGDCRVEPKVSVSLESGLKEGASSDKGTLDDFSLESGLKGTQLNEKMVQLKSKSKKRRERQKRKKLSVLGDSLEPIQENGMIQSSGYLFEKEHTTGVPENRSDGVQMGNAMVNVKQGDCRVEPKVSVSLESGLKEGANSDKGTLDDISLESGLKGTQLNEQMVQLESKRKKRRERQKRKKLSVLGDSLEPIQENGMIQSSSDLFEKEHTTGVSENRSDGVMIGNAMPAQVLEEVTGNCTGSEAAVEGRKRKRRNESKKQKDVAKDDDALKAAAEKNSLSCRIGFCRPKKKLLVLDLNGILVDVVQRTSGLRPDFTVSRKAAFKRPFCDDFLHFCFSTFNVGIWSSRLHMNVCRLVNQLLKEWRSNLLFCWTRKQCTVTKFKTIEDKKKPLVLKELRRLWEKKPFRELPLEKGEYDKSNTLLLDDSPYKALRNPANTAVFPYPYQYTDAKDTSLGPGGDIRKYLEGLAAAENVQEYVEQNPFGQPAITKSDPHWDFYCQIIDKQ